MKGVIVAELHITFAGVCIHLHGVVPGVPMRTVLPDATSARVGVIRIPTEGNGAETVKYYSMPHVAIIRDKLTGGRHLHLPGAYLRVINAREQPLVVEPTGEYRLIDYSPRVELDSSVAYRGIAMAYFDIMGGRVWTEGKGDDQPRVTHVVIRTDGRPKLRITPLPGAVLPMDLLTTVETEELHVTNLDFEASTEDTSFDFLLNFLVAQGGIPRELAQRTPGMPPVPKDLVWRRYGQRLKALGTLIETQGTVKGWHESQLRGDEPGAAPSGRAAFGSAPFGSAAPPPADPLYLSERMMPIDPVPFSPSCSTTNYP